MSSASALNPRCSTTAQAVRKLGIGASQQGRLHRAAALLAQADRLCAADREVTLDLRLSILGDLGRFDEAQALLRALPGSSNVLSKYDSTLAARRVAWTSTTAQSLFELATQERQTGHTIQSSKLFEQSFERAKQLSSSLPHFRVGSSSGPLVAAGISKDGGTLTLAEEFRYGRYDLLGNAFRGHSTGSQRILALSRSGSVALVSEQSDEQSSFRCLDLESERSLPLLEMTDASHNFVDRVVTLSNDGTLAAAYAWSNTDRATDCVAIWNCRSGKLLATLEPAPGYADGAAVLAFSPSGKLLGLSGRIGTVVVWNVEQGSVVLEDSTTCACDATELMSLGVGRVFWALDESVLLTQSTDASRRLFLVKKREPIAYDIPANIIGVLDDGHTILSELDNYWIQSMDLRSGVTAEFPGMGSSVVLIRGVDYTTTPAANQLGYSDSGNPTNNRSRSGIGSTGVSVLLISSGRQIALSRQNEASVSAHLHQIDRTSTAFALFADGTAEVFGNTSDFRNVADCVAGKLVYPFEVCEDQLLGQGKLRTLVPNGMHF